MQIGAFEVLRAREQQVAEERELLNTLRSAHLARLDLQELLAGSLPRAPPLAQPGQCSAHQVSPRPPKDTEMPSDRRQFLMQSAALSLGGPLAASMQPASKARLTPLPPGQPLVDYRPVITPNGTTLPWKIVAGVKVFHLVAEPVRHEFAPGLQGNCWGYNGRVHGPTIEAVEGDQVRIYVTNKLDAPTTVHWHGMFVPNGMDGVGGLTQRSIEPGETFCYEFTLRQHGTFMYHSHHDEMVQIALGMVGMFVVPAQSHRAHARSRFLLHAQ